MEQVSTKAPKDTFKELSLPNIKELRADIKQLLANIKQLLANIKELLSDIMGPLPEIMGLLVRVDIEGLLHVIIQ